MILAPQHISIGQAGSCFAAVVGDITNLGIGAVIANGVRSPTYAAALAFNNSTAIEYYQSENPATTASYIGWDWSAAPDTCRAIIRRVGLRQFGSNSDGTVWATAAVVEVSDDLVAWTPVHSFNPPVPPAETFGPMNYVDIPAPVLARACRIRPTALSSGGSVPVWVVPEAEFIENVS